MNQYSERIAALLSEPSTDASQDAHRKGRVERTGTEMMSQGKAIRDTLDNNKSSLQKAATQLGAQPLQRIVILGCGDSWFTAIGVRAAFEQLLNIPTEAVQAFDFAHYYYITAAPGMLVIGLSSSGRTPAVVKALERASARGAATMAITNTPDSPLTAKSSFGLIVHATREGWPTQSSTAAMALLLALALELASAHPAVRSRTIEDLANDLNDLPRAVDEVATHLDAQMQDIAEHLAEARLILFTGAGPHFAAAAFGAAKTKELSPIHAYAQPLEEYHHYRSQKAADPLFLVAPDQTSRERALDTALVSHTIGGNTVALVPESEQEIPLYVPYTVRLPIIRDELSPILYSVPLHLFAYHFSMARFKRNLGYPSALGSTRDSRADVL